MYVFINKIVQLLKQEEKNKLYFNNIARRAIPTTEWVAVQCEGRINE